MKAKVLENGDYRDLTPEEIAERKAEARARAEAAEREYWENVPYGKAVSNKIHEIYDIDAELAIQRQKDEKPEEYAKYYAYCEECKAYVKEKKSIVL